MDYTFSKNNPGSGSPSCIHAYVTSYPHNYAIFYSADAFES